MLVFPKNAEKNVSIIEKGLNGGIFRDLNDYFSEHFTLRELRMIKTIVIYYLTIN